MKLKVKNSKILKLVAIKDRRGDLFIAAARKNIPFSIKRIYFINNLKSGASRGGHAHKKQAQAVFCANGSFVLKIDDGKRKQQILMNRPETGFLLKPKLWVEMGQFSKNCVILLFSSDYYKEKDYIRNYDNFLKFIKP